MKKSHYVILAALIIAPFLLFSCDSKILNKYDQPINVGEVYDISCCGERGNEVNPFDPPSVATVLVLDKMGGYVQYCWAHDSAKQDKVTFSRSTKTFNRMRKYYTDLKSN